MTASVVRALAIAAIATATACGASSAPPLVHGGGTGTGGSSTSTGTGDQSATPAARREPVQCGSATCGPDEYCDVQCTCCGIRPPVGVEASGTSRCLPLPAACASDPAADCGPRVVQHPCA